MHPRAKKTRIAGAHWCVVLALMLAAGNARRAAAEPTGEGSTEAPAVVVASVLDEDEEVRAQVEARLLEDLQGKNTTTPDGQPLVIDIAEAREEGSTVRVGFRHGAQEVFVWTCACGAMELQQQLPGATLEALRRARLLGKREASEAPSPIAPPAAVVEPQPAAPRSPDRAPRGDRGLVMLATGIGITGLGATPLAAGSAALINRAASKGDLPPWAIACAAAGGVLVSVGVPLIVIGHRRDRPSSVAIRLVPTGTGIAVRGRF